MTAEGQEDVRTPEPAQFCGKCGTPLEIRGLPACFDCLTQEEAVAAAQGLQRLALTVMRGWDRAQAMSGTADAAERAAAAVKTAQEGLPALKAAVTEAIAAERKAQDRHREFAENARKAAAADKRAQREDGSAERQTNALHNARAAADVATRARAALEGATAARVAAEAALAAGEAKVADLEETAARAQHNATHPPEQVAMSEWTAFTCHPALVLVQPGLTDMEKAAATLQVKLVAQLCGLEEALIAEGHAEGRKAAEDEARKRPVLVSPDGSPGSTRLVPPIGTWRGGRHWNVRGGASKPPGSTGPSGATWSQGCAIPSRPACALSPYRPSIVGGGRQRHPAARRSFPLLGSQGPSG